MDTRPLVTVVSCTKIPGEASVNSAAASGNDNDPFGDDPFGDDPFGDDPFGGDDEDDFLSQVHMPSPPVANASTR